VLWVPGLHFALLGLAVRDSSTPPGSDRKLPPGFGIRRLGRCAYGQHPTFDVGFGGQLHNGEGMNEEGVIQAAPGWGSLHSPVVIHAQLSWARTRFVSITTRIELA
jgi:hypothetical protein